MWAGEMVRANFNGADMMTNYTISNAADLEAVGLPKFLLGTWTHYNTTIGEVRLGRVSGKGAKFASLRVEDFNKAIEVGLMVRS